MMQHRWPCSLPPGNRLVCTDAAMAANSFSSVFMSVAFGLHPLKDMMLCPCRDSMTALQVDIFDVMIFLSLPFISFLVEHLIHDS